jgi:hypothetical protein
VGFFVITSSEKWFELRLLRACLFAIQERRVFEFNEVLVNVKAGRQEGNFGHGAR